jgi:small subunit ribosomal protein S6
LRNYEFMYIVSPEVDAEDLEQITDKVGQMIADGGGEVMRLASWSRRRLAYPIRKFREGHYVLTHLQMDPQAVTGLKARLVLTEEVIRYLLVRTEEMPPEPAPTVSQEEPPAPEPEEEEQTEEETGPEPEAEAAEPEADLERDSEASDQQELGD